MYFQLSILAVLAPLASALTFTTPTNWASGGFETVSWTTSAGDPSTFTVELSNPAVFNAALGILNNVNPALESQNFTLSIVPAGWIYSAGGKRYVSVVNPTPLCSSASSGGSGSSSSSSAGPNPSSFNGNGAASNGAGSWLAMIAAAVAGVAAAF
ncbi:hypothetical protein EW026_g2571 [Hermanssonia centrifuga]|uniref:Uncharacterized protein n=1 Tax=Hermanssonia centrifuga TaxID=98765 RepID=A0A4S4KNH6_9APHY|nr:hypothetical protein EW026_g2571 [Hermanssonia centrifuga]